MRRTVPVEPLVSTVCSRAPEASVHRHWYPNWRWYLDEVFVRIDGKTCCLWCVVDHEGEVLEVLVTKRRDRRAALRFPKTRDEASWPAGDDRDRQCGRPDPRSLAQQPGRELAPAVPTNGQFRGRKDPAEICFRPCIDPQPFQPRTSSQPPRNCQSGPGRRLGRVASIGSLRPFDCRFQKSCPFGLTMPSRAPFVAESPGPSGALGRRPIGVCRFPGIPQGLPRSPEWPADGNTVLPDWVPHCRKCAGGSMIGAVGRSRWPERNEAGECASWKVTKART